MAAVAAFEVDGAAIVSNVLGPKNSYCTNSFYDQSILTSTLPCRLFAAYSRNGIKAERLLRGRWIFYIRD